MNKYLKLDAFQLKLIAVVAMLVDHVGWMLCDAAHATGNSWLGWSHVAMNTLGRVAFPLFVFLLVEGFRHTRSRRRYLGRMALFALLSEWPFRLYNGTAFFHGSMNAFATLTLILLMLFVLEWVTRRVRGRVLWQWAARIGVVVLFAALTYWLPFMYGWKGIVLAAVLFWVEEPWNRTLAATLVMSLRGGRIGYGYLLLLLLLPFYSGERGGIRLRSGKQLTLKWFFYLFYPLHLLLLGLLR